MVAVELNEEEIDVAAAAITAYFGAEHLKYFPKSLALRNRLLEVKTQMEREAGV